MSTPNPRGTDQTPRITPQTHTRISIVSEQVQVKVTGRTGSPMGSQGPTRASCAGTPLPMTSRTAPDPRAPVSGHLPRPHRRVVQPSLGRPARLVGEAESKAAAPQLTHSGPPVHLASARLRRVAASFATQHLPTLWGRNRSLRSCSPVAWLDGRKDCELVRDCVRARGLDWRPCVGGHGTTAASRAGAPPVVVHSASTAAGRGRY